MDPSEAFYNCALSVILGPRNSEHGRYFLREGNSEWTIVVYHLDEHKGYIRGLIWRGDEGFTVQLQPKILGLALGEVVVDIRKKLGCQGSDPTDLQTQRWRGPGTLGVGDEPTGLAAGWEEAEKTQMMTNTTTCEPTSGKPPVAG
ncbi:hypothetical protein B0H11DRAFT_1930585 [Mycena galericulata]|nr:hypothetical protein B0H11DRAFT_1930585 [Mycena galericulata]